MSGTKHKVFTILLVEDEPLIRDLARMMLESLGYDVSVAENPIEALKIVEEARGRFDLMLSDTVSYTHLTLPTIYSV